MDTGTASHHTHILSKDCLAKVCLSHYEGCTHLTWDLIIIALGRSEISCASVEFVTLTPPSGQTCGQYMQGFISSAGGYLTNPEATDACEFCSMKTADKFLADGFNIFYDHHWRNFGIMMAFFLFNVSRFLANAALRLYKCTDI